jgi:cytochrome c oxidase subunit 4
MEFNDNYPQYEIMAQHSEEEGKSKRKNLWKVFWIMLGITLLELFIGFKAESLGLLDALKFSTVWLKLIFVGLTIVKAAYIVLEFMHLGHERKSLKYTIITPYVLFVLYLVWIALEEGTYSGDPNKKAIMNQLIIDQQHEVRTRPAGAHEHSEAAPAHDGGEGKHEESGAEHH